MEPTALSSVAAMAMASVRKSLNSQLLSNDLNDKERVVDHPPSVRLLESLS